MTVRRLSILAMVASVAWFCWPLDNWTFQWAPILSFLPLLINHIRLHKKQTAKTNGLASNEVTLSSSDAALYKRLLELLPSTGVIYFLEHQDFLLDFELDTIKPISEFLKEWDNAEYEFQNTQLENLKKTLLNKASTFSDLVSKYTTPNRLGRQAARVDEQKHIAEHEERFRREATQLNAAAREFAQFHQKFVRTGRSKLNN